jgi:leucyl aminopeptidase (aminopeptidase T)
MAYPECIDKNKKNGNHSALHWDIVKDFRKEGGEIYFDGKLVQKDGKWKINV